MREENALLSNIDIENYYYSHIPAEKIHEDSCGKKSIGETTKSDSASRLTSSPRKAKCIFGATGQRAFDILS
ncbi:hypothetical protein CWR45_18885 [Oceanobacillus chungangensis]|uniref:Uncharacterized protein n=1 Tax=Oceanobacillus chungangensis TaxID=1229152 RepID=A0A3D8PG74_9BACI|nr:hypothetical protein CWR45_18885 [Oceanobacillus chungangensis]